jgi:hypothetical protein
VLDKIKVLLLCSTVQCIMIIQRVRAPGRVYWIRSEESELGKREAAGKCPRFLRRAQPQKRAVATPAAWGSHGLHQLTSRLSTEYGNRTDKHRCGKHKHQCIDSTSLMRSSKYYKGQKNRRNATLIMEITLKEKLPVASEVLPKYIEFICIVSTKL